MICEITNKLNDYIDYVISGDRVKNHYLEYSLDEVIISSVFAIILTLFGVWWIVPVRVLIFKPAENIRFKCGKLKS